ncbi:MAG TPA: 4-(cytidine 5'-diphospho)-2-C-methyl-D-erythritol kinase [Hydrogenophaga sp.]|uniref:4-(cytidine 5'-diphospho)-2-C-methyl-D-erythritol kinase n=1 Tax=Hydrogenophaga sp. TaxID=1904254 RepID=UPI002CA29155|nr:4-(cytidine 5'-diphospho)-2-C-methyl-D-erythritol kinase [Hydrogenophaga sp.]HMN92752.1 4-(cytidine 5'-diphospho)-2-C-methyl-D-erythritol kinase [Hydrogenophaga sp.]HMP08910.1 4-(cytidine 5'-diphospho)-2-C-methyl-D-erythritol kinase [Hydrogenophaga sp.]
MTGPAEACAPERLLDLPAPAKLNLFLHINGRRADGYHLLQSVFMLVDWSDRIDLERRADGQVHRLDTSPGELPASDLCVRAAEALRDATGCRLGVTIRLTKRLPAEAGMGGGSSDAATCLIGLNRLWRLGLPRKELAAIGLELGADVPFFIGGRNAWVEGVGERLSPVRLPAARFVVVKPQAGVSTARIFASSDLKRDTKTAILQGFAANDAERSAAHPLLDLDLVLRGSRNDLQPVAQALCPEIGDCIQWLESLGLQGRMTGSGSAVFAQMRPAFSLPEPPGPWLVKQCSNMDAHPLLGWCSD